MRRNSDQLLRTDIHTLAGTTRFSEPANPNRMTLEVPQEWRATFERATSTEEWDRLLKYWQRMPNHIYLAAVEACRDVIHAQSV